MPEIVTRLTSFSIDILGQATQPGQGQPPPSMLPSFLMLILPMMFVWYFLILRPQNAEKKRRADLLGGIKKNDRVCTIGGVFGTVVNVKDDEITLKVDESNNTKITFQRSAIARIVHSDGGPAADSSVTKK